MSEDLIYIPPPQNPAEFNKKLAEIGGRAPNGLPRLRVVWGMDEKEFRKGRPDAPKYLSYDPRHVGMPFWIIEQWMTPKVYNEAEWELERYETEPDGTVLDLLGDFPRNGTYWMVGAPLMKGIGEYQPLDESVLEWVRMFVKARTDTQLDAQLIKLQKQRKTASESAREAERLKERDDRWSHYKTHGDSSERSPARSFPAPNITLNARGERTTPAGLVLP